MQEQSRVDLLSPQQGFLTGGLPIAGVMALVFELLNARFEKFVAVVMVEGNTGAEDVDQSKPFMLDRLLHQLHQMLAITAEATSHKGRSVHDGRSDRIDRLRELSQGLGALYQDLGDRMEDVLILTMSEFGRTVQENGNAGTDHGHANVMFALGGPVKGGRIYGRWPGLASEQLYEGRDLALTTDFRDVFAEVLVRHLGCSNTDAIFPDFQVDSKRFKGML